RGLSFFGAPRHRVRSQPLQERLRPRALGLASIAIRAPAAAAAPAGDPGPSSARKPLKWPRHRTRVPAMPFVVTENCIKCKYTDCVEVCPVDCFHEGPNFLVIDPDECIDCTLCE